MAKKEVERKQFTAIVAAPWRGRGDKLTYSLIGLGTDGYVYRLDHSKGWVPVEGVVRDWKGKQEKEEEEETF